MSDLAWIVTSGLAMSAIALVYIAATALLPQITAREDRREEVTHTVALFAGLGLLLLTARSGPQPWRARSGHCG